MTQLDLQHLRERHLNAVNLARKLIDAADARVWRRRLGRPLFTAKEIEMVGRLLDLIDRLREEISRRQPPKIGIRRIRETTQNTSPTGALMQIMPFQVFQIGVST